MTRRTRSSARTRHDLESPCIDKKPRHRHYFSDYRMTGRRFALYQHRIRRPRPLSIHSQLSLVFEQLTRPSRKVLYYALCQQYEHLIGTDVLLFLVRPIQLDNEGFASAHQVKRKHIRYALKHQGVQVADIHRIPGSVCEFRVLIRACDARYIPSDADPLLVLDPIMSKIERGLAIPPLLFEMIDPETTAPSRLLFRDDSKTDDYIPHYPLLRNLNHLKESNQVISAVLDNNFNVLPLLGPSSADPELPFTIPKLGKFRQRNAQDEMNVEFGLHPYIANVIVDWEQVLKRRGGETLECLTSNTIDIVDTFKEDGNKGEYIVRSCMQWTCPTCFAESNICLDQDNNCRYLKWKSPGYGSHVPPPPTTGSAIPHSRMRHGLQRTFTTYQNLVKPFEDINAIPTSGSTPSQTSIYI
jgi:hypothetical protein